MQTSMIQTMGLMTDTRHWGRCFPSGACVEWKSKTGRTVVDSRSTSSAEGFKSSVHYSPTFSGFQAYNVDLLRPCAPYCHSAPSNSSAQADLGKSENLRGRVLCTRKGAQGQGQKMFKTLKFSGGCIENVRAAHRRRLVGMIGAVASGTNATVGEHEDGAPIRNSAVDVARPITQLPMETIALLANWKPPRYIWRSVACLILAGQVIMRIIQGKVHVKNTIQQLENVGPRSLGVSLLTASFVGMVFTIQFVREFARLGLTRSVGGVLALALARELSPVVTAIILAGRVGSAFAAELGTMQVSEQTDTLRVLRTDPVDYLVTPRVIACCISLPILTIICFTVGMAASVLLADSVYSVSSNIILESAARALQPWDLISTSIKSIVFGGIISIVSCAWGVTTSGGAKGVGESTTSAVVISLVCIFIADFILSWLFFQGAGDALKAAMG